LQLHGCFSNLELVSKLVTDDRSIVQFLNFLMSHNSSGSITAYADPVPKIPRHVVAGWDVLLWDVCSFMLFGANQFALLHFRYTRTFFDLRIVVIF